MTTDGRSLRLLLFVAGITPRSRRAVENLRMICERHLEGQAEFEIIDIHQQPERARNYDVVAAPTLVRLFPLPVRHVIGDLCEHEHVARNLQADAPAPGVGHVF